MLGQADIPVVQLGVSEELVHSGREASITCRVQNQGDYKSKLIPDQYGNTEVIISLPIN